MSACRMPPSVSTLSTWSFPLIPLRLTDVSTRMPLALSWRFAYPAMSSSKAFGMICGAASITVTSMSKAARFSATSSPMKPAPQTTALRHLLPLAYARIATASSGVRTQNVPASPTPSTGGTKGSAPVAMISLSYVSSKTLPSVRLMDTAFLPLSTPTASQPVCTCAPVSPAYFSGEFTISSSLEAMSPPM